MTPESAEAMREYADGIEANMELTWGAYDPVKDRHVHRKLVELDSDHLENILVTQFLSRDYKKTIARILRERGPGDHVPQPDVTDSCDVAEVPEEGAPVRAYIENSDERTQQ